MSHEFGEPIDRVVQEYVPGKQITLAHMVANPTEELCERIGVAHKEAIGILTLTPGETAIIAGDVATKSADVGIGFLDRFSGSLVITGSVGSVGVALDEVLRTLEKDLGYTACQATRT